MLHNNTRNIPKILPRQLRASVFQYKKYNTQNKRKYPAASYNCVGCLKGIASRMWLYCGSVAIALNASFSSVIPVNLVTLLPAQNSLSRMNFIPNGLFGLVTCP